MQITVLVKYYTIVADSVGRREERRALAPGATVRSLLLELAAENPDLARLALQAEGEAGAQMRLFRNGHAVLNLDEALADGDEVLLFPAASGGS